ncbi:copper resistance protein NlpE N-terminal domain-containing protein [Bacteroides ovatus]|uniref:copper resistance protein NlpE N-terminal domain-containing protein n=2 Tax=Bacteroides ovatus TaxID=28116 RepID=UPI00356B4C85
MKKKMAIIAVLVIAFVTSYIFCGTEQNDAGVDSIKIEEYTTALSNKIDLDSVAGTYCGVLPPDVETTLTLNADGTYLLTRTFKEKQNEREKLRGVFQMLDGNVLMLVHPSSGDNIFYKVREDKSVVLLDSFGNEPKNEDRKNYTLRKK